MKYLDTETCGLTGPVTLVQSGTSKDDIELFYPWERTIQEGLDHVQKILESETLVLFNAAYDSFHLNKMWNTWSLLTNRGEKPDKDEVFEVEKYYWQNNMCLRPRYCYDIFILLRRHLLQFLMVTGKDSFKIKKVPKQTVRVLRKLLEDYAATLNPLLFYRSKERDRWKIVVNDEDSNFVDFYLNFHPSSALKPIVSLLLGKDISGIEIPPTYMPPDEKTKGKSSTEYRPYNNTWPKVLDYHLRYWHTPKGVTYATNDIIFLDDLYHYILEAQHICRSCSRPVYSGETCKECGYKNPILWPDKGDRDSELAWMIGQVRSIGYPIDVPLLEKTLKDAEISREAVPTAPKQVMAYLRSSPDWQPLYGSVVTDTAVKTLDTIIATRYDLDTRKPLPDEPGWGDVADRALKVKCEREINKQIDLLRKLQEVGRAHPDFAASGTKSNRMAGRGGLNYQGINRDSVFREIFTMVSPEERRAGWRLSGGDFEGQEVSILAAVASDPDLTADLIKYKSIHLIMWRILYNDPEAELSEIKKDKDRYTKCKNSVFAWFYGAEDTKFAQTAQISIERAREVRLEWFRRYPGFANYRQSVERNHSSITQPNGIGTQVLYSRPADYVESKLGYRRYYNLENGWIKFSFDLANNLPSLTPCPSCSGAKCSECGFKGNKDNQKVLRRDREQTIKGAVQSALYGSCFGVQGSVLRTAGNHVIQSTGGEITKIVQHNVWTSLQPIGISEFKVKPMNVHDEIICANDCPAEVSAIVHQTVESLRDLVPLLSIDWKVDIENWSGK